MPGLQGENLMAPGSPIKKSRLSLKFLHKRETKRALDFSEPPPSEEPKATEVEEPEASSCDQTFFGPLPRPSSPGHPLPGEKSENLVPFVGLNNLGNTCYLNSILQVLYYCPGFREEIKKLYSLSKRKDEAQEEAVKSEEQADGDSEPLPAHLELLSSFNSLITSVENLQSNFLLNSDSFSDGELAAAPRKILNTLRHLNPMYEGFLQHDAQEVLQCILGYVQEACDSIRKEQEREAVKTENCKDSVSSSVMSDSSEDGQTSGKRKSDTEAGNAKKKPKPLTAKKTEPAEENFTRSGPLTRSKRKSLGEGSQDDTREKEAEKKEEKKECRDNNEEEEEEGRSEKAQKEGTEKGKKRGKLSWLKPSGKQPSIFSKFLSVGKITSRILKNREEQEVGKTKEEEEGEEITQEMENSPQDKKEEKHQAGDLDLMERLFQGQLVLRTRCLECESFTERREDFQDISVPVLDEQPGSPEELPQVSPDPKPEVKTLQWAISQFASVERIVGQDKYFCETCRHYTEAERSLLFDKTPEVITIHLKRFSANGLEMDPYAGLSKVNTPLQTPLSLSLEEWCTRSLPAAAQQYQLFAVVMHSGVTISSGHYTAYIRMSNLEDVKVRKEDGKPEEEETTTTEESKEVKKEEEEEAAAVEELLPPRAPRRSLGRKLSKKQSEGVGGLLGGQRSASSCDLTSEKAGSTGAKRRKTIGSCSQNTAAKKDPEATKDSNGNNLLQYEGKWLLFDDSEVRPFEEEDVLKACSPQTSSSLTPYLLFYRRTPRPDDGSETHKLEHKFQR